MAFTSAPDRAGEYAKETLTGFMGTLQLDSCARYNRLLKRQEGVIRLAHCWADARRKLFDVAKAAKGTPIADDGIVQIRNLYRIEKDISGNAPEARSVARQERLKPIIEQMEVWRREPRSRVSAKSPSARP